MVLVDKHHADLLKVAQYALEYIDAIPSTVELPSMPGFDRDWANEVIAAAKSEGRDESWQTAGVYDGASTH